MRLLEKPQPCRVIEEVLQCTLSIRESLRHILENVLLPLRQEKENAQPPRSDLHNPALRRSLEFSIRLFVKRLILTQLPRRFGETGPVGGAGCS